MNRLIGSKGSYLEQKDYVEERIGLRNLRPELKSYKPK
jgi:hypothetical protein